MFTINKEGTFVIFKW